MRALSGLEAQKMGVRGLALSGDIDAPAVELTAKFAYQSYLDSTLGVQALLRQPPNEQIVPSTRESVELAGYAVGLHPSSETPVAIQFKGGQQQGGSATYRLKPGQILRPFGAPGVPGKFSGFEWGLPFGWLGGGNALLVVFRTSDADADWLDRSEIVYHRIRLPIQAAASVSATVPRNWPTRFPWPWALQGANSLPQRGQPVLSVTPTRTLLRLRMATVSAAASMRVLFVGTDHFAETDGVVSLTDCAALDMIWGSWSPVAIANLPAVPQYQTMFFSGEFERLGANDGGVIFVDTSGGVLAGQYVDVIRYGVL